MTPRGATLALLAIGLAITLAPVASAQEQTGAEPEPTVNESDFDTGAPPPDESYLAEDGAGADAGTGSQAGSGADPTLSEGDFDVSAPPADESYLDAAEAEAGSADEKSDVPAPGLLAGLAALAVAALVAARRA